MRTWYRLLAVLAAGIGVDLASMVAWAHPEVATPFTVAVLGLAAIVAATSARGTVVVVLLELLWGGHGYLFRVPMGGIDLSLRMGIFLIALACTIVRCARRGTRDAIADAVRHHPAAWPFAVFACTILLAAVFGILRHPFSDVFFDANSWAFFALMPVFLLGVRSSEDARAVRDVFLTGAAYLILRTYALLFAFSHDLGGLWVPLYQWIRDTRLGEITMSPGRIPRVFLPSMALLFPAALLTCAELLRGSHCRTARLALAAVLGGSIATLVVCLSRSFWLAGAMLCAAGAMWPIIRRAPGITALALPSFPVLRILRIGLPAVILALSAAWVAVRLPYPAPLAHSGWGNALAQRFSAQDPAAANRWQELSPLRHSIRAHPVFGGGFGTTVTYTSRDPRTLVTHPDGQYTTTAFEWGYLDHALESGRIGVLAFLVLLAMLIVHGLRRGADAAPLAASVFALALVHVTTPYLNHPIGIGVVLWLLARTAPPVGTDVAPQPP